MSVRKTTLLALFTTLSLAIFAAESAIPPLVPIPGIKLGLANIVTVYVIFAMGPWDALLVLSARVFLGAVFAGQPMTLIYSAAGGLLSWCVLCLLNLLLTGQQIWLASPVAAIFHNLGQLLAAAAVLRSWAVMAYLPYLTIAGVLAGLFTGVAAQALIKRLNRARK